MTIDELNQWLVAAEELGIGIVLGPNHNRPETITITRSNVDQLVRDGVIKVKQLESCIKLNQQ